MGVDEESAAKAVRSTGGAALVARLTADSWRAESGHLELHAIGHSAGAIFHAHFLPLLTSQKVPAGTPPISVQSLHFLAPAATNALFKKRLMPIIGRNKPVNALTMYTMRDDVERKDPSVPAYGKSLLYLVRAALEDETNTELVGLDIEPEVGPRSHPLLRHRRDARRSPTSSSPPQPSTLRSPAGPRRSSTATSTMTPTP